MSSSRNNIMNVLSMNGGDGEHSYASNSDGQRHFISESRPVVEENINEMLLEMNFPESIKVADLGGSSGQNTLFAMSQIVNTIIGSYQQNSHNLPEIECCLNDLPVNDFNTTFKLVPSFQEEVKEGNCFVSGVPGSFYTRLFPKRSLHFVFSSFSIHFLSKVPQGLEDNKKNIYIRSGCSLNVCQSYMNQFQNDFSLFLRLRSEEMLSGGRMVLLFSGKKDLDPLSTEGFISWSLLSDSLADLVSEGIVEESKVNSFNLPFYNPNEGEVREIVENEGSFEINKIETYELPVSFKKDEKEEEDDEINKIETNEIPTSSFKIVREEEIGNKDDIPILAGRKFAAFLRAVTEPMLVAHFGDTSIIDPLFDKFAHHATQYFVSPLRKPSVNITVSLIKK